MGFQCPQYALLALGPPRELVRRSGSACSVLQVCTSDNLLEALLAEFFSIFDEPHDLPWTRSSDHITLV
jgi:hypothetical protein